MARPLTRSEFARLAKVSPAAITKACKGSLKPACTGTRIDLDHPAAIAYLTSKGVTPPPKPARVPTNAARSRKKATLAPTAQATAPPELEIRTPASRRRQDEEEVSAAALERAVGVSSEEIESYAYLTLDELTQRFGTARAFRDFLDARKKISEIREKDLANDETEGRLIDRELVRTHVFGAIEASNRRLLGDSPKTIARRLYALAKSGAPVEEAETIAREIIASQLKAVKATASRVLRNA